MIAKSVPARSGSRTFAVGVEYITQHEHQRALSLAGSAFNGGIDYATAPQKAAWVHLRGVTSVGTAAIEMEATAALSKRCTEPVYHLILAYAKNEHPTREQVVADAERLLAALKMEDHQYVLSAHQDTDDFHAHVIANRVGPDGRANDLWHERIIRERVCAEIAAERGWKIVVGHHNRDIVQRIERLHAVPDDPAHRLNDVAYRRLREQGELPWQDFARPYILDATDRAQSWDDLHRRLDAHGVIIKVVERGGRVQGLAFLEGTDEHAPGCGASRIDRRCALSALEQRFGKFTPMQASDRVPSPREASVRSENVGKPTNSQPWSEAMRSLILAEVDAARSWTELMERLHRHGIVVKLVQRGGHVQGLAFAEGEHPDAPGCGASKIDPRCKKAALEERFGAFPRAAQERTSDVRGARSRKAERMEAARERQRAGGREVGTQRSDRPDSAKRQARISSERIIQEARGIAGHARMRAEYAAYRKRFVEERGQDESADHAAAWERERARRELEVQQRREARNMLRAVARVGSRGPVRQLAYWTIDAVMTRRREREYVASRARWAAEKVVLAAECGQHREESPMSYQEFVAEQVRRCDRSQADLAQPVRSAAPVHVAHAPEASQQTTKAATQGRVWTISEVRAQLAAMRLAEQARYERAQRKREDLTPCEEPDVSLELEEREAAICTDVASTTAFSESERAQLTRFAGEKRSWNPLARAAVAKAEEALRAEQQRRYEAALREALQRFSVEEAPRIKARSVAEQQRYVQYVERAHALEAEMNDASVIMQRRMPELEHDLAVIELAGATSIDGIGEGADLREVGAAIERCMRRIPEEQRSAIEQHLQREHEELERMRDYRSMDE